jgi:tetratricopeptide (TPR) repeat protein
MSALSAVKVKQEHVFDQSLAPVANATANTLQQPIVSALELLSRETTTPLDWERAYKDGIRASASNLNSAAIRQFSLALDWNPECQDARYMRASLYLKEGNLIFALKDLEEILSKVDQLKDLQLVPLGSFEMRVLKEAASIHLQIGNLPSAMSYTLRGLYQDQKSIDFLMLSAKIYWKLGDTNRALDEIDKILAIKPDHAEAIILAQQIGPRKEEHARAQFPLLKFEQPSDSSAGGCLIQ